MDAANCSARAKPIHPIFAFLLAGSVPLFFGGPPQRRGLRLETAEPQWSNSRRVADCGGDWSLRVSPCSLRWTTYCALSQLGTGVAALLLSSCCSLRLSSVSFDSLVHARDAWAIMPDAPSYSAITTVVALLAAVVGFSRLLVRETRNEAPAHRWRPLPALRAAAAATRATPVQYGADPELPDPQRGLLPTMKIAEAGALGRRAAAVPQGYTITAIATDFRIPRQTLVLPNGDILVAEGRAAARRRSTQGHHRRLHQGEGHEPGEGRRPPDAAARRGRRRHL